MGEELPVQSWGLWEAAAAAPAPPAPQADEEWVFPSERTRQGGFARVYYAAGNTRLTRPVILSDGFNSGPSKMNEFWQELNGRDFAFADELSRRGYDLILLGYDERSASILDNAKVATACVLKAIAQREGDSTLAVGGFSMGGLITRYALAKMEYEGIEHQTSVYYSYDSPHRGAWIPVSLQALAHFMTGIPALSKQINSPASRQLLWRHIATVEATPEQDPLRTEFLAELEKVGGWPSKPLKLGIANGRADGVGNGVPAGAKALECTSGIFNTTLLKTQTSDNQTVLAHLKGLVNETDVRSRGLPELDGAPGGKLESFGIAADNLTIPLFSQAVAYHREICFVPTISAVAVLDITAQNLGASVEDLDPTTSELDEFVCSTDNTPHSKMTVQLGEWLLDRLPEK